MNVVNIVDDVVTLSQGNAFLERQPLSDTQRARQMDSCSTSSCTSCGRCGRALSPTRKKASHQQPVSSCLAFVFRFAKWRATIKIQDGGPSEAAVARNADELAQYAKICQTAGLVPIVEPEILIDGSHTIQRSQEVRVGAECRADAGCGMCGGCGCERGRTRRGNVSCIEQIDTASCQRWGCLPTRCLPLPSKSCRRLPLLRRTEQHLSPSLAPLANADPALNVLTPWPTLNLPSASPFTFLPTRLPSSQPVDLPPNPLTFLPTRLPSSQPVYLPPNPFTFLPARLPSSQPGYLPPNPLTFLPTRLPSSQPVYLPPNPFTFLPTHLPSSQPVYLPPNPVTFLPTRLPSSQPEPRSVSAGRGAPAERVPPCPNTPRPHTPVHTPQVAERVLSACTSRLWHCSVLCSRDVRISQHPPPRQHTPILTCAHPAGR
eukprot:358273-Chlamydomonas_euryale.AAC.7